MSRYNEILVGRYNRFIQKLLGMKGPATMPQVAAEMQPVFPFFNGAELRYLEGWNRFGQDTVIAGVAAVNSAIRLRNPSTSNVIAVIEKLSLSTFSAADTPFLQLGVQAGDLTNVLSLANSRFDPRGSAASSLIMTSGTNVASGVGTKWQGNVSTTQSTEVVVTDIQEFPLLPGDAATVFSTANNITMHVTWWWRERFLEDSERT